MSSHYDCRRCGEYLCTDMNCMSEERVAAKAEAARQDRIRGARRVLDDEVARRNNITSARKFLIAEGVYDENRHGRLFD